MNLAVFLFVKTPPYNSICLLQLGYTRKCQFGLCGQLSEDSSSVFAWFSPEMFCQATFEVKFIS